MSVLNGDSGGIGCGGVNIEGSDANWIVLGKSGGLLVIFEDTD